MKFFLKSIRWGLKLENKKINIENIPVFIISYNRLDFLLLLVSWLENAGFKNINIIDNKSTYQKLIDYLSVCPHKVHRMEKNYGHLVLWESKKFDEIIMHDNFILTDCDILPVENCPYDIVDHFIDILGKYTNFTKVGLSLKIDDVPDCYAFKNQVLEKEKDFWLHPLEDGLYQAAIDTTFALYKPGIGPEDPRWWRSIRTGTPYEARHLPWYSDTNNPSEEDLNYQKNVAEMSSYWSVTDLNILKEHNSKLQDEVWNLRKKLIELEENYLKYKLKHLIKNSIIYKLVKKIMEK